MFTASAFAGGFHDHVQKYRVVQGYILQPQAATQAGTVQTNTPSANSNAPTLKLASGQAPSKNELSLSPPSAQPSSPQTQTVTLQLAPPQPQTMTVQYVPVQTQTLQLTAAPAQTLQLTAAPVQTLQLAPAVQTQTVTLQLATPVTQTLQLSQQPANTQCLTATPVQILIPKHHFFFGH